MFSLPVRCCNALYRRDVTGFISYPRNIASKADTHLGILLRVRKLAVLRERYEGVVKSSAYRNATTKCTGKVIRQTNKFKLPKVLPFVEFNTTMALAILAEQRDFVGEGVGQSLGCEIAQRDLH